MKIKTKKKLIKKKFREEYDFVNWWKENRRIDYQYDDEGNIIAYDDGSALEYETEKLDDIKSKIYGV